MLHKPRKRFGQNFLIDQSIISQILSLLHTSPEDHWVEIGPGQGALTKPLLQQVSKLDVIELDRDLVANLHDQFNQITKLTIHSGDALAFNFTQLVVQDHKLRIIGNLPYNISTPLLFHLMKHVFAIQDMHFMLQKEVVDRICAAPGTKQYGRLSIMLQYYCQSEFLFEVPPESFVPPPKVNSAIIRMTPHSQPPVEINNIEQLNRIVTLAFSQRRKTIRNALKKVISEQSIKELNIDPGLRPEMLSLTDYSLLSQCLD